MDYFIVASFGAVVGAALYHQALKRDPARLQKLLDKIKEAGEKVGR